MLEWHDVDSSWIAAEAYDPEEEIIYLRFKDGVEWGYHYCPPEVWEEMTAPSQSRGEYFHRVLKHKPNARRSG